MLRAVLRLHSQRVQLFAAEVFQRGDHVGANALVGLRMNVAQMQIATVDGAVVIFRHTGGGVRHHFYTASDAKVVHTAHDVRRGQIH